MVRVSLIKGADRRENVSRSLELISDDIKKGLGPKQVVIKPNFVSTSIQLAATHLDHVRGMLDFLSGFYRRKVIIAEAAAGNTQEGFKNFGYHALLDEYDVELVDLNRGESETVAIKDSQGRPLNVRVAKMLLDRESYLMSAAMLKTHDAVVVTLSLKNMAMGSVLFPDKLRIHQGIKQTNLNIAKLAERVWPDLSVIDGLEGMEGEGPSFGSPIHLGVALAGTDALALDRVACEIMGVDASRVGYLNHCARAGLGEFDMRKINIIGALLNECIIPFRLHSTVEEQYKWR